VAILALSGVSLVATSSARNAPPRLYTVAATEACLKSLPNAIAGLPPATPPAPPALFFHPFPRDRVLPAVQAQLGAWYGHRRKGAYEAVTLRFYKSGQIARRELRSLPGTSLPRSIIRNVLVAWDQPAVSGEGWRKAVRGCLRAVPPADGAAAPKRPTRRASLATFAGRWGGHTRGLRITSGGKGLEGANDGCCVRLYQMTFQILSVTGTLTRATAAYRVTSFRRYDRRIPRLHAGRVGKLVLRNGIVTNTLTDDYFCSDPAWGATGACGA
jgi:hypothetical protein